jgi:2,4-dienoyl-CoA reductase-like NADH-dependent reductase (Old Yellow Enzyme family)
VAEPDDIADAIAFLASDEARWISGDTLASMAAPSSSPRSAHDEPEVIMSTLFTPIQLGAIPLKHRVVMAPITRLRSDPDDTASALMAEHYGQRASDGGLIIVESAGISIPSRAYYGAPGLYLDPHVEGYRRIADGIHAKGGKVVAQLATTAAPATST